MHDIKKLLFNKIPTSIHMYTYNIYTGNHLKPRSSLPVIVAYTVVYIRTVVIKDFDTAVTNSTVFGAQWFDRATGVTETTQGVFPLLPIIKMCYL